MLVRSVWKDDLAGLLAECRDFCRAAGAEVFLAPQDNCADLSGRVPEGLTVYAVDTLSTARAVVDAVAHGRTPEGVRTCG